jgi:hypothetical protein
MSNESCPICDRALESEREQIGRARAVWISCSLCGEYGITEEAQDSIRDDGLFSDPVKALRVRHHWFRRHETATDSLMTKERLEALSERPLPDLSQQVDLLVLWLGRNLKPGQSISLDDGDFFQAVVGSETREGCSFVGEYLVKRGLFEGTDCASKDGWCCQGSLTFEGWANFVELQRGAKTSRRAFFASKWGDSTLDQMVERVFRPAVRATGFELFRLDDEPKAGLIDDRLRVEIRRSRFLIADLTHGNNGAYWEAGYAEGLGKPVIYVCEQKKFDKDKSHFDTNHHLTVAWDENDPETTAAKLKDETLSDDDGPSAADGSPTVRSDS